MQERVVGRLSEYGIDKVAREKNAAFSVFVVSIIVGLNLLNSFMPEHLNDLYKGGFWYFGYKEFYGFTTDFVDITTIILSWVIIYKMSRGYSNKVINSPYFRHFSLVLIFYFLDKLCQVFLPAYIIFIYSGDVIFVVGVLLILYRYKYKESILVSVSKRVMRSISRLCGRE